MNKQKYYRRLLKQCENPGRSCMTVKMWGVVCIGLGVLSVFLVYQPVVQSRADYLIFDLFVGGVLFGIGNVFINQASLRRLFLDLVDQEKLRKMITESASKSEARPPQG